MEMIQKGIGREENMSWKGKNGCGDKKLIVICTN